MKLFAFSFLVILSLAIKINGIGIANKDLEAIFKSQDFQNELVSLFQYTIDSSIPSTLEELSPSQLRVLSAVPTMLVNGQIKPRLGARIPIIPPGLIPDPLPLPALNIPALDLNISNIIISGGVGFQRNSLTGQGGLNDDLSAGPIQGQPGFRLKYTIGLPELSLNSADYFVNLVVDLTGIDLPTVLPLEGTGYSFAKLDTLSLTLELDLVPHPNVPNKALVVARVTIGLTKVEIFLENLTIDGEPFDLTAINELITSLLPLLLPIVEVPVANLLDIFLNAVVEKCTFQELEDFISGVEFSDISCLTLPGFPFPVVETTQTPEPEPTTEGAPRSVVLSSALAILALFGLSYQIFN